jgi:cellulose synthase/poly-beta-1,6-N-acetylglucosamine synthase-like glycosyltransferase
MDPLLFEFVAGFYGSLYVIYFFLIVSAGASLRGYRRRTSSGELERIAQSAATPTLSMIIPAYNEEMIVLNSVQGALNLRFPKHEVIVINDGSTDNTLAVLIEGFVLRRSGDPSTGTLSTKQVHGVYRSSAFPNLIVVDKANGRRADAINAGVNLASHDLLCVMDADSILEEDALLRSVRPFMADPRVIAAGGVVRPINGLLVEEGRIKRFVLPRRFLSLVQAVEYLRSFQWARLGLAGIRSMLCISGAFLVVKKDVFFALHGCNNGTITDDIEFTIRLHRYAYDRRNHERGKVVYIPDGICYTEVPETLGVLAAQRNRWQRGTMQSLIWHRSMMFNPRYGLTGMFGMPFFLLLCLAPLVEAVSYLALAITFLAGFLTLKHTVFLLALMILLGVLLSIISILLQWAAIGKAMKPHDLLSLLAMGCAEHLGYQQMHTTWQLAGMFDYFVRGRTDLGKMTRYGSYQQGSVAKLNAQDTTP